MTESDKVKGESVEVMRYIPQLSDYGLTVEDIGLISTLRAKTRRFSK